MHLVGFTIEIYYDARPYERHISTVCVHVCVCVCVCARARACVHRVHKVIINRKKNSLLAFIFQCR